jgi:hypothetical protein
MPKLNEQRLFKNMTNLQDKVCIVGGGPAGLAAARALGALGIEYTIFESEDEFGGLWNDKNPASPIYNSAHLISSRTKTGFDGFPMPEEWADYPGRNNIRDYVRQFAEISGAAKHARLGEGIKQARPLEQGWEVETTKGNAEQFRWLIAANGSNWKPIMPSWPGEFTGTLRHASTYRSSDELKGQRILVVGLGNSGVDIACDTAQACTIAHVSIRRGYHVIPKHILGKPADVFADDAPPLPFFIRQRIFQTLLRIIIGDLRRFGMPKPDHRLMETHPLLNDQFIHYLRHGDLKIKGDIDRFDGNDVVFVDGHRETYDQVICATGYDWETPYLPEDALPFERGRLKLPLCIFTPREDLFALSFVESNGSSFNLFGEMAFIIARSIAAQIEGGEKHKRLQVLVHQNSWDVMGGLKMQGTDRHVGYVDNRTYRKALMKLRRQMGWPKREILANLGSFE